jgi:hypothetical protein
MERTLKVTRAKCTTDKAAGLSSYAETHRAVISCAYLKLNLAVMMVQSAQNWQSQYATGWLDGAPRRHILFAWR